MKCPLRVDGAGNFSSCYKEECAWWVEDTEVDGREMAGACSILEVAVNGILVTIADD